MGVGRSGLLTRGSLSGWRSTWLEDTRRELTGSFLPPPARPPTSNGRHHNLRLPSINPSVMSGHSHAHDDPSHSHSHDHGGVPCGGHDREPPSAEEIAAHRAEKASFDRTVKAFYHYEAHSVGHAFLLVTLGTAVDLTALPLAVVCQQPKAQGLSR